LDVSFRTSDGAHLQQRVKDDFDSPSPRSRAQPPSPALPRASLCNPLSPTDDIPMMMRFMFCCTLYNVDEADIHNTLRALIMQRSIQISNVFWGQSASDEFFTAVIDFVQRHGTVRGLVTRMEAMGLGSVARSWLYTSVHEPIFSEQLHALFGTGVLRAFAAKLNISPRDLVRNLSQTLPRVLNRLVSAGDSTLPV
jgi:uncharacterized protein YidB (DUF937 family)